MTSTTPPPWRQFERLVAAVQRRLDPTSSVSWNERVIGSSGAERQLDVVVRGRLGSAPLLVVIECKDFREPVGIEHVDAFIAKLVDVRANGGILVAKTGFTKPARLRAAEANVMTSVLRPASDDDWAGYLRGIEFTITSQVVLLEDVDLHLVDGRILRVNTMEQVADENGKSSFIDRVLHGWLSSNRTWTDGEPLLLPFAPPLRLLRDEEEPLFNRVRFRPRRAEGFQVAAEVVRPEDWVFYRQIADGTIAEKEFFEFEDLRDEADSFARAASTAALAP
jgi:hypothetical protein